MKDKICQVNEEPAAKLIAKGTSSLSDPELVDANKIYTKGVRFPFFIYI
jgi:hypothetical protein